MRTCREGSTHPEHLAMKQHGDVLPSTLKQLNTLVQQAQSQLWNAVVQVVVPMTTGEQELENDETQHTARRAILLLAPLDGLVLQLTLQHWLDDSLDTLYQPRQVALERERIKHLAHTVRTQKCNPVVSADVHDANDRLYVAVERSIGTGQLLLRLNFLELEVAGIDDADAPLLAAQVKHAHQHGC